MSDDVAISFTIKPTWSIIKKIQERTVNYMNSKGKSKDLTDATMMCVTELIENAVKYGEETNKGDNIEIDLRVHEDKITIRVTNGLSAHKDLTTVAEHIDKLKKSNNPAELYTQRLKELLDNTKPSVSQLGLYRIAYEGEFKLDYRYSDNMLTIIAERKI